MLDGYDGGRDTGGRYRSKGRLRNDNGMNRKISGRKVNEVK